MNLRHISDTDAVVMERQYEAWRRMSDAQKLEVVMAMNETVRQLAVSGIRERYPHAGAREQFLRLAQVTLGDELARKAYPDLATLDGK